MEWSDDGIILATRRHGETSVIVEALTGRHGRHLGIVRGGRSRRMHSVLQPGNRVRLIWRARLEDHLGTYQVEPLEERAMDLIASRVALAGFMTIAAHARLLPERDPNPDLSELFAATHDLLAGEGAGLAVALFERDMLSALGFGLDLESCAATGGRADLAYVSPKSGRAVSAQAGAPYAERLFPLPAILRADGAGAGAGANRQALGDAFRITGHFLSRHVWGPRAISPPAERDRFVALVCQQPAITES